MIFCLSSHFYILIFPLITNRSLISLIFEINLDYLYFGILSSLIMPFMSHLIQLRFYPCFITTSGFHKLSFYIFILNKNSQKYYNGTWCTYAPLQSHVLYTLSGRGVTPLAMFDIVETTNVGVGKRKSVAVERGKGNTFVLAKNINP